MLKEQGINGDFVSCFPLKSAFELLHSERNKESIKFGKIRDENSSTEGCLYEYTKEDFMTLPLWYFEQKPDDLKQWVVQWVETQAAAAQPGDIVTIIFEGHGTHKPKSIVVGHYKILTSEFVALLARFRTGVQVNLMSGACYSGEFVKAIIASSQSHRYVGAVVASSCVTYAQSRSSSGRIRNSRSTQAFVQSFTRIFLPGSPNSPSDYISIKEHHDFTKRQVTRNLTPGEPVEKTCYGSIAPVIVQDMLFDVVIKNKANVVYNPAITHRRRLEWPQPSGIQQNTTRVALHRIPDAMKHQASELIDEEYSKCGGETSRPEDLVLMNKLFKPWLKEKFQDALLEALHYRARQQLSVWNLSCDLVDKRVISSIGLVTPIELEERFTTAIDPVLELLSCFEFVAKEEDLGWGNGRAEIERPYELWHGVFEEPTAWLATMIVRGASINIGMLLETIEASGYLGPLDQAKYRVYQKSCRPKDIVANPKEREYLNEYPMHPPFGFWLPHGVKSDSEIDSEYLDRFTRIEEVYEGYFKQASSPEA